MAMIDPSTIASETIVSPKGYPIKGTLDSLNCCAEANFGLANGSISYEHTGLTEVYWEEQATITVSDRYFEDPSQTDLDPNEVIVIDDNGDEWPLSQCVTYAQFQSTKK